jgi:hypothetical protein
MSKIVDNPFAVFVFSLVILWCAAYFGDFFRRTVRPIGTEERVDFDTVLTATLTLLALIISFSFSMAVNRYDQRKNYEETEANAIGTAYLRADLLPGDNAGNLHKLLRGYANQRISFYEGNNDKGGQVGTNNGTLEAELWSTVAQAAAAQSTPVVALAVASVNEVLNSQGYTQAAWLNRIPVAAWGLMGLIAVFSNLLLGYRERKTGMLVLLILPVIVSIAFFLISDIDSPRGGVIRVAPQNLISVSQFMQSN